MKREAGRKKSLPFNRFGRIPPGPIVVIGSVNMDLVCRVARMPGAGETILGRKGIPDVTGISQ